MPPPKSLSKAALNLLALAGVGVASYALYIEFSSAEAKRSGVEVSFFCDKLVAWASCSRALTGPYGRVLALWGLVEKGSALDVPNSAIGLAFYLLTLLPWHATAATADAYLAASVVSLAFSLYLAYVLKFIIHEFCIICVTSYSLNVLIFVLAARLRLRLLEQREHEQRLAKAIASAASGKSE